jgi:hypothetical protein
MAKFLKEFYSAGLQRFCENSEICQGTTSVVPQTSQNLSGFSR